MTRLLIHWRFLALPLTVWATVGISWLAQKKPAKICWLWLLGKAPWADRWHIADVTGRYANSQPNDGAKCHSRQIRCRVIAKSAGSGESVFTSMDVVGTLRTVA
jgi:hypothetical protein